MRRNPENRHQTRRSEHHLRKHPQQKQIKESFSLSCIFFKLPPPQISLIPSPSLNTSFFLSQDCALALTACRVCCVYSFFLIINFSLSLSFFLHGSEPLIGPFGPRLPSRLCLCRNPAAFHWMPAAEGNTTGRREGGERDKMWKGKGDRNIEMNDA